MELQIIQPKEELRLNPVTPTITIESSINKSVFKPQPFIEANTIDVQLSHLRNDCIVPVFSKDNERTISHNEFIQVAQECASDVFPNHIFDAPEIRVSHQIKGRVPSAVNQENSSKLCFGV